MVRSFLIKMCGLDTYTMKRVSDNKAILIDSKGIAWTSDRDQRFKLPNDPEYKNFMWQDVTDCKLLIIY